MRTSRNYPSTKLIPNIPVRVRRKPGYLKRLYLNYNKKIENLNEQFCKFKYDKGLDKYFDKAPLPDRYYTNQVVLIPKNITTLYTYWEVREDTFKHLKDNFEVFDGATIQLYKNGTLFRKIENLSRFGSYYILNVEADKKYQAVLGFENKYGHFFEVAPSTFVISPSGRVSNRIATIWGIPSFVNGKIRLAKYSREFLPDEDRFKREILNTDNLYLDIYGYERLISLGSSLVKKIGVMGSSNKHIGSTNNLFK